MPGDGSPLPLPAVALFAAPAAPAAPGCRFGRVAARGGDLTALSRSRAERLSPAAGEG